MLSGEAAQFYRDQLDALQEDFDHAREENDLFSMDSLAGVAAVCLLRLAGVP